MKWQPIETIPEGVHVLLYFPVGERGSGGIEAATVLRAGDGFSYWTHGGPNSGMDWYPHDNEMPSHWAALPEPPTS
ncbi:MAG TPA: hypothetical protein VN702_17490 [Acetobacteraceae bacterium]|nr:hypothetical protein [Acetobacteraceae bacterium]